MKALRCEKVTKRFGQLAAVKDLSFEVEEGEIFGIAGPNGSGKSTLFNLITGFYHGSGDIIFNGDRISRLRPHQICRKGIARTFQVPNLFSTMTVLQNVKIGAHFGVEGPHDDQEITNEAINSVGLKGKENAIAATLNTLDLKRTMIAAALATKPKLLLLDEPMAGLAPMAIRQTVKLLQKISSELGVTLIIVEHRMRILMELCHRLMILNEGAKVCIGPPQEVLRDKRVSEIYLGVAHA